MAWKSDDFKDQRYVPGKRLYLSPRCKVYQEGCDYYYESSKGVGPDHDIYFTLSCYRQYHPHVNGPLFYGQVVVEAKYVHLHPPEPSEHSPPKCSKLNQDRWKTIELD